MSFVLLRRLPPAITALLALTLGLTIAVALDARWGGSLDRHLSLQPEAVFRGELWRLVTWPFIHTGPLPLIFTCVTIYVFGTDLRLRWGARAFRRHLFAVLALSAAGTCLLALAVPSWSWMPHHAGLVLMDLLVIAWARQFPDAPVTMYFLLMVRGPAIVTLVIAVTLVFTIFVGIGWMSPELLAIAASLLLLDRPHRRWWLKLRLLLVRRRLRSV